jgi:hypothetical protein
MQVDVPEDAMTDHMIEQAIEANKDFIARLQQIAEAEIETTLPCASTRCRSFPVTSSIRELEREQQEARRQARRETHQCTGAGLRVQPPTKSPELVLGPERDNDIGGLGLMGLELAGFCVAPAGDIHDHRRLYSGPSRLHSSPSRLRRLHDIESVIVDKESVLPEQPIELWYGRMVLGNGLAFELSEGSLNLCGSKLHRTLLFSVAARR